MSESIARCARGAAFALAIALAACAPPQRDPPPNAFDGAVADWTREILADSPELATARAVPEGAAGRHRDRLDDRAPEAEERRRTAAIRRDVELRAFRAGELTPEQQLTHAILRAQFANAAALAEFEFGTLDPLGGHAPYVLDQQASAFLTLPDFFDSRVTIADLGDADDYLARLRQVAPALDGETQRSRADADAGIVPPDFIIDRTVALLDRITSTPLQQQVYLTAFRRKLDAVAPPTATGSPPTAARRRAEALYGLAEAVVRDRIIPAHQRAAIWLRALRARAAHESGVWRLPGGDAYYRAALRAQTTTALSPEEIHRIGLARVAELTAEADSALRSLGMTEGTVGQRLAILTRDPQYQYPNTEEGRAQLIADIQTRIDAVMRRAPDWFDSLPRARLEVRRVPAVNEASSSGAYYEAPALDGSLPGVYYVNLRHMAEMTRIDLPTQDYHEAAPGHHFQIALAQEREGLPLLRRLMGFNAYAEGWGLYAEQLVDEHSLYADDPIGRIGYLRWQIWRAARLVVDTGIHAKRWSREEAIDYLVATTGDTPGVAVSEVERYVAWPGQACGYELGRREIVRLREQARRGLGARFDLASFHDVVLLGGEVPLTVLADEVGSWIDRRMN
ncbi:MAG: DUF885 family protein [Alphaproteobacteria bacterium]|nr:DUF885 family protein [Alphaproteobacteria bacterium]